jgi:hypothetical protein
VLYLRLIILSIGSDVSVDSETLLVIDFINFKIKPTQSFRVAHRGMVCVCVYRDECLYIYKYMHLYCVSKKDYYEAVVLN